MLELDASIIAATVVAAILVGLSKGGLSMLATLAVPVCALAMSPVTAAALLLPILVVSDMYGLWSYRREYDRRTLQIILPAATVGILIGWATASWISDTVVGLMIGLIGLGFCLNSWRVRHQAVSAAEHSVPRGSFWGAITGFVSFVSHTGGPPYQVYVLPLNLPKLVYAGTTTIAFAAINAVKLVPYYALGQLNATNLRASLFLMPIALASTWCGIRLVRMIPDRSYFIFVQVSLLIVSLKLIWDALHTLL